MGIKLKSNNNVLEISADGKKPKFMPGMVYNGSNAKTIANWANSPNVKEQNGKLLFEYKEVEEGDAIARSFASTILIKKDSPESMFFG